MDQTYAQFENVILEVIKDLPKALAKTNPEFVIKIVRILENEYNLDRALNELPYEEPLKTNPFTQLTFED